MMAVISGAGLAALGYGVTSADQPHASKAQLEPPAREYATLHGREGYRLGTGAAEGLGCNLEDLHAMANHAMAAFDSHFDPHGNPDPQGRAFANAIVDAVDDTISRCEADLRPQRQVKSASLDM